MVDVLMTSASVTTVGMASFAIQSSVIRDAMNTVNVKTELVCASPDGTESIVRSKDVLQGKQLDSTNLVKVTHESPSSLKLLKSWSMSGWW